VANDPLVNGGVGMFAMKLELLEVVPEEYPFDD
jgi:hypothetical protein